MTNLPLIIQGSKTVAIDSLNQAIAPTELAWTVTQVDGSTFTSEADDQVSYTKKLKVIFSPSLDWNDKGEKGTSVVDWQLGSLWPLQAGNRAYYHRVVTMDDGATHEENWRCSVDGPSRIKLSSSGSEMMAFKINCITETNTHTWYWVDGMSEPLKYIRSSSADGEIYESIEAMAEVV